MWPQTAITGLLNIKHPIIQAPMILQKPLAPLAITVSNAGGLGSLGCAEMTIEEVEKAVTTLRKNTDGPFNLNFFLHKEPGYNEQINRQMLEHLMPFYKKIGFTGIPDSRTSPLNVFNDEMLSLLLDLSPPVVSFHFGVPQPHVVKSLKQVGCFLMATATTVNEAKILDQAGIDAIIAQGWEAGGHRGSFETNYEEVGIGTLSLVPQVVDAVRVPVIAAGGIGDGRGIAAAFALGASGVSMGTAFLTCLETPITDQHRGALLNAKDEDTQLSRAFSGRPCRGKKNPYSETMINLHQPFTDFPTMYNFSGPLKKYGIDNNDLEYQFLLYGQSASLNRELNATALIEVLAEEALAIMRP